MVQSPPSANHPHPHPHTLTEMIAPASRLAFKNAAQVAQTAAKRGAAAVAGNASAARSAGSAAAASAAFQRSAGNSFSSFKEYRANAKTYGPLSGSGK